MKCTYYILVNDFDMILVYKKRVHLIIHIRKTQVADTAGL